MIQSASGLETRLMVGMEVHVELATRSKMFTDAPNVAHADYFEAGPNTLCDPVVLGMPGVLPVMNKRAVEMAMLVGLALGCKIAKVTKWDRKSYYYPDLPKNYQISQYDQPLCYDGALEIPVSDEPGAATKGVGIIRAHLEEDAGKLLHEAPGGYAIDHSIVDLNRAGTPLLEIVTQPDLETPEEVVTFGQTLRNICRALGVTEGIMQKGHMRFEPNINVIIKKDGRTYKTPIVEIKNLNSFKALYGSVKHEYERQVEEWVETGKVMGAGAKSTRGWDDARQATVMQREKEDTHEYRYFPDPDLVPVTVSEQWLESVKRGLIELPLAKERRYTGELGLGVKEARALLDEPRVTAMFEEVMKQGVAGKRAAAVLLNNLAKRANERGCRIDQLGITPGQIKVIDEMAAGNKISSNGADELYGLCCSAEGGGKGGEKEGEQGGEKADPVKLAETHGLLQVSDDSALGAWVDEAIAGNPKSVEAVRSGKEAAVGAIVGAVMKLSKGKANPKIVGEMIKKKLIS